MPGAEIYASDLLTDVLMYFFFFFRLRATGVVNVENPVKKALDEGRFEEIDDVD